MKEIFLFCNRYKHNTSNHWLTHRTIYTNSSKAFVSFYAYREYSSLHLNLTATSSRCKLIRTIQCGLGLPNSGHVENLIPLQRNACTVVQFFSGHFYGKRNFAQMHSLSGFSTSFFVAVYGPCFDQKRQYNLHNKHSHYGRYNSVFFFCEKMLVFPTCEPNRLTIDQTSFEDRNAFFSIETFLDHDSAFGILTRQSHNFEGRKTRVQWTIQDDSIVKRHQEQNLHKLEASY